MKRAIIFLIAALFILLVVEPNAASGMLPVSHAQPLYQDGGALRTNDDVERGVSNSKKLIMIDPSRGGWDTGYTAEGQLPEKELAMQWAQAIGSALESDGYQVIYSRWYDDIGACTTADECNALRLQKAKENNVDLILSLQFNQDDSMHKGWSLFIQPDHDDTLQLAQEISSQIRHSGYSVDEGIDTDHYDSFVLLSDPEIPGVVLQLGYLTSTEDYQRLADPAFQQKLSSQIAQAFLNSID